MTDAAMELRHRWKSLSELLHYLEAHPKTLEWMDKRSRGLLKPLLHQWIKEGRPCSTWRELEEPSEIRDSQRNV